MTEPAAAVKPIRPSKLVRLDRLLGLRGWGLILYGALPANLALIGAIKVEMKPIANLPLFLAMVVPLPIVMTYLLIRTRQKEWYLTADRLALRSAITTLLIILLASLITGAARLIQGDYVFGWAHLFSKGHFITLGESFLFGIATLVVSSTLFMTILTKGSDLPGLPSTAFVSALGKVRQGLKHVQEDLIWEVEPADIQALGIVEATAKRLEGDIESALGEPGQRLAKQSLKLAQADLACFLTALDELKYGNEIDALGERWNICFGHEANLTDWQLARREELGMDSALQRMKGLRLGG
ncbi:MAG: hypothetical protein ACJ74G_09815 [Blastocatellia bacterium]